MLIAVARGDKIGRYVQNLMTEWDACARPRPMTAEGITKIAEAMPRIKTEKRNKRGGVKVVESLDMAGARAHFDEWMDGERRRVLGRLRSLNRLMDPDSGLLPWVMNQGIQNAREKLLDVLGWWADRNCPECQGTRERGGKLCKACHGSGHREVPHGHQGRAISEYIARKVDAARDRTIDTLGRMKQEQWKRFAAGKK